MFFKVTETPSLWVYESISLWVYESISQCQGSEFLSSKSHVVTAVFRQAVECEARNPCIHDRNDIKSAEGTTEVLFCRAFSTLIYWISFLQAFRTACFITCLLSVAPTELFFCYEQWALSFGQNRSRLIVHSSLLKTRWCYPLSVDTKSHVVTTMRWIGRDASTM